MLKILKNLIEEVIPEMYPVIIIITVIAVSLRIAFILKYKGKFVLHKELYTLIFILYIMCLFEVVTFQDINYGTSNYVPFKEIFRYDLGSRLFIKNILGNILLFLPYGYFISDFLKTKKVYLTALLTFIVSLTIETVQLRIGRTFDIDDIILNVAGGILGFILYKIVNSISNRLPKVFKNDTVINVIVIILIIAIILYSFNLNLLGFFGG